jgi:alanyl-tRNA synthetase
MTSSAIRQKFLDFFGERGHAIVPSSSLIPDDPSVLLTTAGMQQFKKYFTGELDAQKDFGNLSTASCQKSFRTSDIDEVGDESHLTFFEMLGNFSFGGYFKEKAIQYAHEFITKEMGLKIEYVTIFEGKESIGVPKDEESRKIWQKLDPKLKIVEQGMDNVFWGPTGSSGPCGPTTEIYCRNATGQDVEVWNIVFNQYFYPGSREELNQGVAGKKLEPLKTPGVDTGMGLERLVMCVQKKKNIFETDLFTPVLGLVSAELDERKRRICADHARATTFLIAAGVRPSNKGAGYILRRVLRRLVSVSNVHPRELIAAVIGEYQGVYPELKMDAILPVAEDEQAKFNRTLKNGLRELERLSSVDAAAAFRLYESYGLPYEVIKDYGAERTKDLRREDFDKEFAKHQEISRAGLEKKFGGHGLLLDTGELKAKDEAELQKVTRLHTATHMLQQALRDVLGPEVKQAGSDITIERTRFDFEFPRKLTAEEIKAVEDKVNEKIREDLPMQKVIMPKAEAARTGALYFFKEKYPDPVNVYFIGQDLKSAWSKEFCGGPHVTHTGEIGKFRIAKEEAVSAGVRRIRGVVEP